MFILDELWNDGLDLSARFMRKGSRYAKLTKQLSQEEEKFCGELSSAGKDAYEAYCKTHCEMSDIAERDSFIKGFRLGAMLILDVVSPYHSQLPTSLEECV